MTLGEYWVGGNAVIFNMKDSDCVDVRGLQGLSRQDWYLVMANHQTWVDIIVLQVVLNRRIPLLTDPLPEILERGMICVELTDYREALEDFRFFVENTPDESIRQVIETRIGELERLARGG